MPNQATSVLVEAAAAFDSELANYTRLGKLFVSTPLGSVKHLERANGTLADIAACEARLQTAGQQLVQALGGARLAQEQLAQKVVDHVPVVHARNKQLNDLMAELSAVAVDVGALNEKIQAGTTAGEGGNPTIIDAQGLSSTILALSMRAEQLANRAHDAELEELATQAHALHQKLQAVGKKLAITGQS